MKSTWLALIIGLLVLTSCQPDGKKGNDKEIVENEKATVDQVEKKDGDLLTNKYWYSATNFVNTPQWRYFDSKGMYRGWIEGKGEPAKFTGIFKLVNDGKSMEISNMSEDHGTETYDIVKLTKDTLEVSPEGANDMSITFVYVEKK